MEVVKDFTPENTSEITGVAPEKFIKAAEYMGRLQMQSFCLLEV